MTAAITYTTLVICTVARAFKLLNAFIPRDLVNTGIFGASEDLPSGV